MRVVVLGAGVGGLATALRLGRGGHRVVLIDRDAPPPVDVGGAFDGWDRRGVPQWRQYHVFRARARAELDRSLPDVLDRLADIGVVARDHELAGLPVRRPVLEWVLRQAVEECEAVDLLAGTAVKSLAHDDRRRSVTGVTTATGSTIEADLVVDAGGRRSPIAGWVAEIGYDRPPVTRMDTGIAYYTRYYETAPGAERLQLGPEGVLLVDEGFMARALAVGDSDTTGAIFVVPASESGFRALGTVEGWEAAVAFLPGLADALDGVHRRPLMDPAAMYGLHNVLAPWRADGAAGPRSLAHLGDSWMVTNPNQAWGSSIALGQANTLADAVAEHPGDLDAAIAAYAERAGEEVGQVFGLGCEFDRAMQRRWRLPTEEPSGDELEREALLFALGRLAKHGDTDVALKLGRRMHLLELPDDLWADDALMAAARTELELHPYDPERRRPGVDRDGFLAAIHAPAAAG